MEKENVESGSEAKSGPQVFGMSPEELKAVVGLVLANKDAIRETVMTFTPVVSEAVDLVLDVTGPEISKVLKRIEFGKVDIRSDVLTKYIEVGFSREEAIEFMLADITANREKLRNLPTAKK